jgi:putative PIN family toxin of toxin-antitoxin system
MYRAVFDTNVLRAALWSSTGASFQIISRLPDPRITVLLSVALFFEYEDVLTRPSNPASAFQPADIMKFLMNFAALAERTKIFFQWRPWLRDPNDEMILDLAIAGSATHIVTFNLSDFEGVEASFGIRVVTPAAFLRLLRLA